MSMTRDQLRAARILLHLRQEQLAAAANMGVATLRRYEGGRTIHKLRVKALREAIERAGAVLLTGDAGQSVPATGIGVALLPTERLPEETRKRIAEEGDKVKNGKGVAGERDAPPRPRGRPRKQIAVEAGTMEATEARHDGPSLSSGRLRKPKATADAKSAVPVNTGRGKRVRKGGNVSG